MQFLPTPAPWGALIDGPGGIGKTALAIKAAHELIVGDCHRIAEALLKQNKNFDEALPLSRRAIEIYTRLRIPDSMQSAQETLAEIESAMQKSE